jgi:TPR repeat protein
MNTQKTFLLAILTILCFVSTGCSTFLQRRFQRGQHAFVQQDYHRAFSQLIEPAQYSYPKAQYAVGYMYYFGLGTQQNDYLARLWFYRAAHLGNKKAIAALSAINQAEPQPIAYVKPKKHLIRKISQTRHRSIKLPLPHNTLANIPAPRATRQRAQ